MLAKQAFATAAKIRKKYTLKDISIDTILKLAREKTKCANSVIDTTTME